MWSATARASSWMASTAVAPRFSSGPSRTAGRLSPVTLVSTLVATAFPVTRDVVATVVVRLHPVSAPVRRTGPVPIVPAVMLALRKPVALNPHELGTGLGGHDVRARRRRCLLDDDGRRRTTDRDPNGHLRVGNRPCAKQQRQRCRTHQADSHVIIPWHLHVHGHCRPETAHKATRIHDSPRQTWRCTNRSFFSETAIREGALRLVHAGAALGRVTGSQHTKAGPAGDTRRRS